MKEKIIYGVAIGGTIFCLTYFFFMAFWNYFHYPHENIEPQFALLIIFFFVIWISHFFLQKNKKMPFIINFIYKLASTLLIIVSVCLLLAILLGTLVRIFEAITGG